jgi:hypothetical protein
MGLARGRNEPLPPLSQPDRDGHRNRTSSRSLHLVTKYNIRWNRSVKVRLPPYATWIHNCRSVAAPYRVAELTLRASGRHTTPYDMMATPAVPRRSSVISVVGSGDCKDESSPDPQTHHDKASLMRTRHPLAFESHLSTSLSSIPKSSGSRRLLHGTLALFSSALQLYLDVRIPREEACPSTYLHTTFMVG